jgi:hypothetical protein
MADLCGLFSGDGGRLFILTTDGKLYRGNPGNGEIRLIAQTALPLQANNLRGDMASCVPKSDTTDDDHQGEDEQQDGDRMHISPNPVQTGSMNLSVNSEVSARVRMQVLSPTGTPVQTREISLVAGMNQISMDATHLHQGVYSVILYFPSGRVGVAKFIRL